MIEPDREDQRHDKQQHQYALVIRADHQQTKETEEEDHQLCDDDIRQNCAHKKAVFTFE